MFSDTVCLSLTNVEATNKTGNSARRSGWTNGRPKEYLIIWHVPRHVLEPFSRNFPSPRLGNSGKRRVRGGSRLSKYRKNSPDYFQTLLPNSCTNSQTPPLWYFVKFRCYILPVWNVCCYYFLPYNHFNIPAAMLYIDAQHRRALYFITLITKNTIPFVHEKRKSHARF